MKNIIKNTLILVAITLTAALCLAVVNAVTKNRIAEAEEKERMDSFYTVMPDANEFKDLTEYVIYWNAKRSGGAEIVSAFEVYDKNNEFIGVVVSVVSHNGYGGDITLSLGVDTEGVITGMKVTSMSETSGLGANCTNEDWQAQFRTFEEEPKKDDAAAVIRELFEMVQNFSSRYRRSWAQYEEHDRSESMRGQYHQVLVKQLAGYIGAKFEDVTI